MTMTPKTPSMYTVAEKALTLGFLAFVLWLHASKFDGTEVNAILMYATGGGVYMSAKAAWPSIRTFLVRGITPSDASDTTDNR